MIIKPRNLVWIDLEMSGLEVEKDVILEIAAIVTDGQLNILGQSESIVINQPDYILENMNEWCNKQHAISGLIKESQISDIDLEEAEEKILEFLSKYCKPKVSPLCGNSVWQDRLFIQKYMPKLDQFLHYRIVDVSSIKEVVYQWYPNNPAIQFKKSDQHRALADIKESVAELQHYKNNFFIPQDSSI